MIRRETVLGVIAALAGAMVGCKATCPPGSMAMGGRCVDVDGGMDDGGGSDGQAANDGSTDGGLQDGAVACTTPQQCDDGDPCTTDACDPTLGCTHTFVDADGDGYASEALGTCAYVAKSGDCDDTNSLVHPNQQTNWYDRPYCVGMGQQATGTYPTFACSGGTGQSFDYNCSGNVETRYVSEVVTNACTNTLGPPSVCWGPYGWVGTVPGCGGAGTYDDCTIPVACCKGCSPCPPPSCGSHPSTTKQVCH